MRTFKEAMTAKRNLKELEEFLIHLESNGLSSMKFVEWLSTNALKQLNEGGPAPSQPGFVAGAFQNVLGKGAGFLGRQVGKGIGGAAGIVADTAKGISGVAGSLVGGLAGGAGTGYGAVTQGGTLQANVNSAQTALQNLEKRMQSSAPLRELLNKPEFKQLLQNLKNAIANDLVKTESNNNLFEDFRQELEYRKIFLELSNNGINPAKVFEFYIEKEFHLVEAGLLDTLGGWWKGFQNWMKGDQGQYDKQAIEAAIKAVQELQKALPQFRQIPTDNFSKLSQDLINNLSQVIGQEASNEADNQTSEMLKTKFKEIITDATKQQNIDNIDPAFFTSKISNNYNNFIKNIPDQNIHKAWIAAVAQKIADKPDPKEIEATINGFQSVEYLIKGLSAGDQMLVGDAPAKLRAMTNKEESYYLSSMLLNHIKKYGVLIKNDSYKLKQWYNDIGNSIRKNKPYREILAQAEEIEKQAGPATTKIADFFAALPDPDKPKYSQVNPKEQRAFEDRFNQIYAVTGYNPKSGKPILDLTINLFIPKNKATGNVDLLQKSFQQALSEKLNEFYKTGKDNDSDDIRDMSYNDQAKIIQKFNKFLKANTKGDEGIKNFWTDIGYKKRNGQDIFAESRRLKKNNAFLESVLGRTRNPQAGWFNY
jgi:hypothetical protein